jgi:hypothetical protein
LAAKILTLPGGTIGEISTLLTRAAGRAINDGSERITNATLDSCGFVALRATSRRFGHVAPG